MEGILHHNTGTNFHWSKDRNERNINVKEINIGKHKDNAIV